MSDIDTLDAACVAALAAAEKQLEIARQSAHQAAILVGADPPLWTTWDRNDAYDKIRAALRATQNAHRDSADVWARWTPSEVES